MKPQCRLELPDFSHFEVERLRHDVESCIASNQRDIGTLIARPGRPSWAGTLEPIEDMNDRLNRLWSPLSHLHSVADSEAIRSAYNVLLPKLTAWATDFWQNEDLYEIYTSIAESDEFARLGCAERRIVQNALRDFRLAGVGLAKAKRDRFKALKEELSRLQTKFEENLLDATQAWNKPINDIDRLAGLPETALALARQAAEQRQRDGWLLTLDFPCYQPVVTYASDRELRREIYEAFMTRASDLGPSGGGWDNSPVMERILAARRELAGILGYRNFAEYSLATKMAADPEEVVRFLEDLARRALPAARRERDELVDYAGTRLGIADAAAWDMAYAAEKLREERFSLSQESLRPYFPVPKVLDGLFTLLGVLFGLQLTERDDIDTWHPDIRFFEVRDRDGDVRGAFYLDLFARSKKRGGAWMDECVVRKARPDGVQIPVAYLTCNFTPPVENQVSLLTHSEVITLFHEFGHGLHHMLTRIDQPGVAGINGVAWDAVELPSQLMENWCWELEALELISGHVDTGKPIDGPLFERMRAARTFQSGMQMVRQLEFALFDFHLHMQERDLSSQDIQSLLDGIRQQVAVVIPPSFNRFQHSFSHIFAGGYAAGYYSYKWAEVLSADAYSKFEESGALDTRTGLEFMRCVLEQGGARDPMELFVEFRGRPPSIDALLRHSGIPDVPETMES